jgi:invasion protein IalB
MILALTAAADGFAQQGQQQTTVQEVPKQPVQQKQQQKTPSPWTKLCNKIKVATETQAEEGTQRTNAVNVCLTFQERVNNKDGALVVSAGIRQQEGEDSEQLIVIVPLGIDLHSELQARIDGGKPVKLDYERCDAAGCTADATATPDIINAMKTGRQFVVEAKRLGQPLSFDLPLAGFALSYTGKASDSKQYAEMREQMVNAIRARRAEQIRRAVEQIDKQQQQQPLQPQQ